MTTPTVPDVYLDEQTRRELTPPCESGYILYNPATGTILEHRQCQQPAAWIVRTRCHCGQPDLVLMCTSHHNRLAALTATCEPL